MRPGALRFFASALTHQPSNEVPPYNQTLATVLFSCPVFPVPAPVIRLFCTRAFSFTISKAFPVFGAHERPVDRLYFSAPGFFPEFATRIFAAHNRRARQGSPNPALPAQVGAGPTCLRRSP